MKKAILLISAIMFSVMAYSQATTTRFGATKNSDNTGRVLNYAVITTTDVAQAAIDTVLFVPNAYVTIWRPSANLADSCVVKFSSTTTTYRVGDQFIIMLAKGTGDGRIRLGGSKFIGTTQASTGIAIAANKSAVIKYIWNGAFWVEISRTVQP
jgi:hypothetical protein